MRTKNKIEEQDELRCGTFQIVRWVAIFIRQTKPAIANGFI
jgi:hypothetical protein